MVLPAQKFKTFFRKEETFLYGIGKVRSSFKGLRAIKDDDNSDDRSKKSNKGHLNKIRSFECVKLDHIVVKCM